MMDIKFQVNKILSNNGGVDDWLDLITQLKSIRTDRDLLLQIHTVAIKNLKKIPTVGYKKLMIGMANLQSELSLNQARETYLDARALDLDCAIVCVFYAQFEYLNQNKEKARQIIQAAKKNGCTPKQILKRAYQNWRQNKLNLLDGILDPWNICDDTGDTGTGNSHFVNTAEHKSSQKFFLPVKNVISDDKPKTLPLPQRIVSKSSSTSSLLSKSKWQTPVDAKMCTKSEEQTTNDKKTSERRHGPGMSPFMKAKYSPLLKRKFDFDIECMSDQIIFPTIFSTEKCSFTTPMKNSECSRSSSEFEKDAYASSDNCTSGTFTSNILKESNSDFKQRIMKKSLSSPSVFECNKYPTKVNMDNHLECVNEVNSDFKVSELNNVGSNVENIPPPNVPMKDEVFKKYPIITKSENICPASSTMLSKNKIESHSLIKENTDIDVSKELEKMNLENHKSLRIDDSLSSIKERQSVGFLINHQPGMKTNLKVETSNNKAVMTHSKISSNHILTPSHDDKTLEKDNSIVENATLKTSSTLLHNSNLSIRQEKNDNNDESSKESFKSNKFHAPLSHNILCTSSLQYSQGKVSPTSYTIKGVRYHRKKVLGKGGSCKVYEVISEFGEIFALKKVNLYDVEDSVLSLYTNEIKYLEKMKGNDYIIRIYEWEIKDDNLFIVLEKGDKDLAHALKNKSILSKEEIKKYWKQIIIAVKVIHENGIIHTDLKPANFLLVDGILKLIDFGIANSIQDNKTSVTRECQMGTLNYMSPEVLVQDGCRVSRASDVWSLGCMLYYMIYKKTPYSDIKNQYLRFYALQQGKPIEYPGIDDKILLDCLKGCLKHDRKERYTLQQLLDHPYLNN